MSLDDTKPCRECDGSGRCDECMGDGVTGCECECGDIHDRRCEACDDWATSEYGDGRCYLCHGTGRVPLTDADREAAGQLALKVMDNAVPEGTEV